MAPKTASGKEKLIDDEDEVLQAVILADSFDKRFRPLTIGKPRCLLPICNAPLLDWTFESLALAGVQEIFVICRSHAEQVEAAIRESKWSRPGSGIKIVPIMTAKETFSAGDAMRDVYTRGLVTSDFVLVMGDLVSNIRIDEVVRVHKERRRTNKDAIMTIVVKESGAAHRTRPLGESSVFVLDAESSECLHYEPVSAHPPTKMTRIPREVLEAHPEIEIRNDLIDCSIDVCSVEVPSLFQDNFDYEDIRRDFLHGVLTSDLLMKNIYCYVAQDGYAARVRDTKSYDAISKDILSRWTFPLVPDDNHPSGHVYRHARGNKYMPADNSVTLARTAKIGNNTLIGASTKILEGAQITGSVIGRNCVIGAGTIVEGSYIFDGTVVGPQCVVRRSIIGAGVTIKEKTRIEKGCLVGDSVVVGPLAVLDSFERLSRKRVSEEDEEEEDEDEDDEDDEDEDEEEDDDDDEEEESDEEEEEESDEEEEEVDSEIEEIEANPVATSSILGKEANAIVWPRGPSEEADEDEIIAFRNQRVRRLGDDGSDAELSDEGSESSSDDDEDSDEESSEEYDSQGESDVPEVVMPTGTMQESEFKYEVAQSLERAFAEGHSVDNAAVELKTLRMASNVPLSHVRQAVISAIVEDINIVDGAQPQRKEIARVIGRWGELIDKIGGVDAVETVLMLQMHCASSERLPLFGQILAELYQKDIVEEDDIRAWYALPAAKGVGAEKTVENVKRCWAVGARMIEQFDEQESESESE
ncbi:nucleotide-diphospho-sugar transferase [Roridomyces roridus]|uniref:Translation initiation factor eIF2B subunit epsilon n=1 Tax=Roridomyces roridus TaxID=1738132 RepID=A0AAD7BWL2_9AGAR|nr:nucleotide-diphospho-sugar transferase [Roridomyces roridus]